MYIRFDLCITKTKLIGNGQNFPKKSTNYCTINPLYYITTYTKTNAWAYSSSVFYQILLSCCCWCGWWM